MGNNSALEKLFHPLPLGRIKGLGGKFGESITREFNVTTVGQLSKISYPKLASFTLGNIRTAQFLYNISRGICHDEVVNRLKPKGISCGKTFRGPLAIGSNDFQKVKKWIGVLVEELLERLVDDSLEYGTRYATKLMASVRFGVVGNSKNGGVGSSKDFTRSKQKSAPIDKTKYDTVAYELVKKLIDDLPGGHSQHQQQHQQHQQHQQQHQTNSKVMIIAMTVTANQFSDVGITMDNNNGSSSIVAAFSNAVEKSSSSSLPSSILSPSKRLSSSSTSSLLMIGRKRSGMDKWLSSSSNTPPTTTTTTKSKSLFLQEFLEKKRETKKRSRTVAMMKFFGGGKSRGGGEEERNENESEMYDVNHQNDCADNNNNDNDNINNNLDTTSPTIKSYTESKSNNNHEDSSNINYKKEQENNSQQSINTKPKTNDHWHHQRPTKMEDIDTDVLNELPDDIKESILKDLLYTNEKVPQQLRPNHNSNGKQQNQKPKQHPQKQRHRLIRRKNSDKHGIQKFFA